MTKGSKKSTAKRAKAKRGLPEPESERTVDLLDIKASPAALRAETSAQRKKDAEELVRMLRDGFETYSFSERFPALFKPLTLTLPPLRPGVTPTNRNVVAKKRKRAARQTSRALWALRRLYPQGVPEAVSTTTLENKIAVELRDNEPKEPGTEAPPPPSYRVVADARKIYNQN